MAIPESEVITVVLQDSSYKLTFDVRQSNGYNPKYDIVTDMKGGTVNSLANNNLFLTARGSGTRSCRRVDNRRLF